MRLTEAGERHPALLRHFAVERLGVALDPALPLAALHHAKTDRIDENPVGCVLVGERLGQVDPGRARHARRQRPGGGGLASHRGHVHDAAAPAPLHVGDHEAAEADRGHELQVDVGLPRGVVDLLEARGRGGAGVVDEDVHAAPARDGRGDERLDLVRPRHVARHREQVGAGRAPDEVGGSFEHLLPPRAHRNLRARAREPLGGRPTEAFARAGDDRDFAREAQLQDVHGALEDTTIKVVAVTSRLRAKKVIAQRRAAFRTRRRARGGGASAPDASGPPRS